MSVRPAVWVGGVVLAAAATAGLLAAGGGGPGGPQQRAAAVERELRCPVCEGQSVAESRTRTAAAMRAQVTAMTSGGASAAEVRSWFVRRYGRGILLLPTSHGPDLALWMTPAVPAVLACGYLTWRQVTVRRSAGRSS